MKSLRIILSSLFIFVCISFGQMVTDVEITQQTSEKLTLTISGYTSNTNIHIFDQTFANLNDNKIYIVLYYCYTAEFGDLVDTDFTRQVQLDLPLHEHVSVNCYINQVSDAYLYNNNPLPDPVYFGLAYSEIIEIDEYPYKAHNVHLDDNFLLEDFIIYEMSYSYWTIAGSITNKNVSDYYTYIKLVYNFWNNNAIIKTYTTYLDYSNYTSYGLAPQSTGFFQSLCQKVDIDSVTFDIEYDYDTGSGQCLVCSALFLESSNFADLSYTDTWKNWIGSAKNKSHSELVNPKIFACFYTNDKLVQIEDTYLEQNTIQPGDSGSFETLFTPPPEYDTVKFFPHYSIDLSGDIDLPVELANFSVANSDQQIVLTWKTLSETNNYCFEVERRTENASWVKIGQVQGHGTTNKELKYQYTDEYPPFGQVYYRLRQIDFDGTFALSDEKQIAFSAPTDFQLSQNYPNPFNAATKIDYTVNEASQVKLIIYNQRGQETLEVVNAFQQPGYYNVNVNMENMASGTYYFRLSNGSKNLSKMMLLVK